MKAYLILAGAVLAASQSCVPAPSPKQDCGYDGINAQQCTSKGCCWVPVNPNPNNDPWCYFPGGPSPPPSPPVPVPSGVYTTQEIDTIYGYFLANLNIQGSGGVVASPSQSNPDYYYHWMRDGSLSMELFIRWNIGQNIPLAQWQPTVEAWIGWVGRQQVQSDPNGQSVLDEPKFFLPNGTVYNGGWCRPQNDGPALRAIGVMAYTFYLLANPTAPQPTSIASLYNLVKTDMTFVTTVWNTQTCDLWEEVRGDSIFWNLIQHRKALLSAATLARHQGDSANAGAWQSLAGQVQNEISTNHMVGEPSSGAYLQELPGTRPLDGSSMCSLNHNDGVDTFLPVTSPWANSTIDALLSWANQAFYINTMDTRNGIPGVMIGRYPNDGYMGGNPWILLTHCMAELHYRRAKALSSTDPAAASAELATGDGIMYRVKYHIQAGDFHMSEQLSRADGSSVSARDLTWSYATFLSAMLARSAVPSTL